jgi:hypothetical protein
MPDFRITLSDAAVARLQLILAEYNVRHGTDLDLPAWATLHLRELAVRRELTQAGESIEQQSRVDVAAALSAEKERLMGLV